MSTSSPARWALYPAPVPLGAGEFDHRVMRPIADQLGFGKITIAEAAARLVSEGKRVISAS
jgi:multiple sugar transport system substrate-binding protein